MFVKYASAYVVLLGRFGTDELAEILILVQIGPAVSARWSSDTSKHRLARCC